MYNAIEEFLQSQNNLMSIRYSYPEIRKITKGFMEKLGEGGYGSVFKVLGFEFVKSIRSSRAKYYAILPHQKSTLLFYHIILQHLIYQMFYIFTTSFKYYILILILSFLSNGNISILFQISTVTFQTKLLIIIYFFFLGRNRLAYLGFKQNC